MFRRHTEPGGYLHWDEIDVATFCAHAPNPHTGKRIVKSYCEYLICWRVEQGYTSGLMLFPSKALETY